MSRANESIQAHIGRIQNRPDSGDNRNVITKHRKIAYAFRFCSQDSECSRRGGRLEADREEHDMLVRIGSGKLERIRRRINNPYVSTACLMFERTSVRARDAHHIAEGGENDVGILRHRHPIIDPAHGQYAHRATRPVNQFNVVRQNVLQPEPIDRVRMSAAHLHQAVMSRRIREPANFFCRPCDQLGLSKLINESHSKSSTLFRPSHGLFDGSSRPYPRTSCTAASLSPSMRKVSICSAASCSLILLIAKPTWINTQSPATGRSS